MEAANNLLSTSLPYPPRTELKQFPPPRPPPSALKLYEHTTPAVRSMITTTLAQHFPTSVLLQEQRHESKPSLQTIKEDRTSKSISDRRQIATESPTCEENGSFDSDQYLKEFQSQLLRWPGLWYLLPSSLQTGENPALSSTMPYVSSRTMLKDVEPEHVIALARKALSASKQAASLAEYYESTDDDLDESCTPSLGYTSSDDIQIEKVKTVRSTRHLERRSRRRGPKPSVAFQKTSGPRKTEADRKLNRAFDANDPLRLFLASPETRRLLTAKEESELIVQIKDLVILEEVKNRLQSQFGREPTLVEWAEAVRLSCHDLQSQIQLGNRSRDKLIYANFRMVVHIAKQYQGRGLSLQDLFQEGSMGLMRSVQKFNPQSGCRFATYAYWWIRQSVRKAIILHSRTIRLPDSVYNQLYKVFEAKRSCIQDGNHHPTKEQIAARAGITVEKVEKTLFAGRMPVSMQQPAWADEDTTFQEITADTAIERPDVAVEKQLMRNHICNLLGVLSPKERKIIRLRFGIGGGKPKSLSDIGAVFRLSKERIRQLESRSLYKLKQYLGSQGLDAYADMLF